MTLLERYVGRAVLRAVALVATGLIALFSLLEFVEQLSSVGQGHYRLVDAVIYVSLTVPARLLEVAPASVLLGSLLVLGTLGRNSELTALQASGVSEQRIVGWVLKLTAFITLGLFLLAQFLIPPAQQYAQSRRTAQLSASAPLRSGNSLWAERDGQYLSVQKFEYGNTPSDIDIYVFSPGGVLTRYIHADRADMRSDGNWLLTGVTRKTIISAARFRTEYLPLLSWQSFLPSQQARLLVLPPDSMPPVTLYRYVRDLKRRGQQATRYEEELWAKISLPFAMAAMVMIAMPFAFGPARALSAGRQIGIGAIIGMTFTLCQQIVSRLNVLLDLNPAFAALSPPLVLMALAAWLFRRAHR